MLELKSLLNFRGVPGIICLALVMMLLIAPAMAATTQVTVTKYSDNNYETVVDSETLSVAQLQALSEVYSNGPVYMQGGTFDYNLSKWVYTDDSMAGFGELNGTYVSDITDLVGGMSAGDEIKIAATDGYGMYFNYTNVYNPAACQGDMILAWWSEDEGGFVPTWDYGLRNFFYTPPEEYGSADSLNFTNADMRDSMASWYWRIVYDKYDPYGKFPSAKGLSVKEVSDLKIYQPHRYDFNTTGDADEYAYYGEVNGIPGSSTVPNIQITSSTDLAKIADDDSESYPSYSTTADYSAAQRFVFNVSEDESLIEKLTITWIGTGYDSEDGASLYIWNYASSSYELLQSNSNSGEITLTGGKTSGISNYIDDNGQVTVLVVQNGTTGFTQSTLSTDYVKVVVTNHHKNSNATL